MTHDLDSARDYVLANFLRPYPVNRRPPEHCADVDRKSDLVLGGKGLLVEDLVDGIAAGHRDQSVQPIFRLRPVKIPLLGHLADRGTYGGIASPIVLPDKSRPAWDLKISQQSLRIVMVPHPSSCLLESPWCITERAYQRSARTTRSNWVSHVRRIQTKKPGVFTAGFESP